MFFVYTRVAHLALAGALRVQALVHASASASTRVLVHASSLSWGGWSRRSVVAERIPSEGSERARRLGGCGELGGAETLRDRRAHGVQGAYSVRACAVRSAWARCALVSSDRALACDSQARSETLASTRGKCASDSSSTRECKPSHTHDLLASATLPLSCTVHITQFAF